MQLSVGVKGILWRICTTRQVSRTKFIDGRLLGADELGEEATFGEKLVNHYRADRVRLLVRLEVKQAIWHGPAKR